MANQTEEPKKKKGLSGLFIPAGIFIGMGVGFITDELVAGLFIGLGVGFVVAAIVRWKTGEW